jgi:SAM-dependent methyltransferase
MTETVTRCDLCGSELGSSALSVYVFQGFSLMRCARCGLVLTNPRPDRTEIGRYYQDGYYAYASPEELSFKDRVKDWILAELGGYPQQESLPRKWVARVAGFALRPHIMVVPPFVPAGRLLDVGCGAGSFLRWAVRAGWDATGLEVDPRGAREAARRGLPVVQGAVEDGPDALEAGSFDVVVMNHTLEHCHDPNRALEQIHRLLKPEGLAIIGVPNFDCYDNRVFASAWANCEAPRHLYHFNPETLRAILERHGLTMERLRFKKWLIPYSERASFRLMRRQLNGEPWTPRTRRLVSAMIQVRIIKKLLQLFHLRPDAELGQFMTAYARKSES